MQSEQAISPCNFARSQPESLLLNRKAGSRGAAPEKFFRCMLTIPRSHPNNPPNPKRQPTWLCKTTRCQRLYVRCNSMYVMYSEPAEREGMADMILAMLRWLFLLSPVGTQSQQASLGCITRYVVWENVSYLPNIMQLMAPKAQEENFTLFPIL